MKDNLWLLEIDTEAKYYDVLAGLIATETKYGWEEVTTDSGHIIFKIYGHDEKKLALLGVLAQETATGTEYKLIEVEVKDWNSAWKQFFTPVLCGDKFVVLPPWLAARDYPGRIAVIIDPKNAFGTGHHASTAICLTILSNLLDSGRIRKGQWFLDLGCGSGILGIAAEKAGLRGTALDIDEEAIINARDNRELNEADSLEILQGSLEKVKGDKFDLVMANILAEPLIEMAPQIAFLLKNDSVLLLSGILKTQAGKVSWAYRACGLGEPDLVEEGEWCGLVW